jgi:hypothetical protein
MPISVASPIQPFHDQIVSAYGPQSVYTGVWFNTIESLTERLDVTSSVLTSLPVSLVLRGTSERSAFFSVYRLVAVLGRLVELATSNAPVTDADIADVLRSESMMPTFDVPPWTMRTTPSSPEEVDSEAPPDSAHGPDTLAKSPVVQHLLNWIKPEPAHKPPPPPPPYVLARAWQRFHLTLAGIDEEIRYRSHQWFLGHLFHRYIIAFLNSLLVEEALHWQTREITTRNPVSDDKIFVRNLGLRVTNSFFDFIWACPLWGAFLEPGDTDLSKEYRQAVRVTESPWTATYTLPPQATPISFANLYPLLNSVGVIGVNARQIEMPPTASSSASTDGGATAPTRRPSSAAQRRGSR